MLRQLIRNVGSVVSRADLLETVWPEVFVTDASLTQCIAELRKALDDSQGDQNRMVPRRGYLLELEGIEKCTERSRSDVLTRSLRPVLAVLPFSICLAGGVSGGSAMGWPQPLHGSAPWFVQAAAARKAQRILQRQDRGMRPGFQRKGHQGQIKPWRQPVRAEFIPNQAAIDAPHQRLIQAHQPAKAGGFAQIRRSTCQG